MGYAEPKLRSKDVLRTEKKERKREGGVCYRMEVEGRNKRWTLNSFRWIALPSLFSLGPRNANHSNDDLDCRLRRRTTLSSQCRLLKTYLWARASWRSAVRHPCDFANFSGFIRRNIEDIVSTWNIVNSLRISAKATSKAAVTICHNGYCNAVTHTALISTRESLAAANWLWQLSRDIQQQRQGHLLCSPSHDICAYTTAPTPLKDQKASNYTSVEQECPLRQNTAVLMKQRGILGWRWNVRLWCLFSIRHIE